MTTNEAAFGALLLAFCVAGCATNPTSNINAFAERSADNSFELFDRSIASDALVLPIEHDRQTEAPSCGAHALASVVNYWLGPGTADGTRIFNERPPADDKGYSIAEVMSMAHDRGLLANGVRLQQADLIRELEAGRPVMAPVRIPSIFVQQRTLPGLNLPVVGVASSVVQQRAAAVSEWTGLTMVDHYVLVVGYDEDQFVVLEPVMGFRTITFERLARYRRHFNNAAIVFSRSGGAGAAPQAPAESFVSGQ